MFQELLFSMFGTNNVRESQHGKFLVEQESFHLLSFVSWLHNFQDRSNWEFRSGNEGVFALISFVLLACQTLVLFDLGMYGNSYILIE